MQFINRKVTLLEIYKSQRYVTAIYKSQSHVASDLQITSSRKGRRIGNL